jgi:hypothetical protein
MGTEALRIVRLAMLAVCAAPLPAQEGAPVVRTGAHFAVHVHPGALAAPLVARLADSSLAAAESCWPLLEKLLGVKAGKPLPVHLYVEETPYRNLAKAAGISAFRDAFADTGKLEAHALVWPRLSAQALEIVGLPETTAHEVVRCAAALVAAQSSPAAVADPWLGEVFAWGLLEELVNPQDQWGVDPAYDTRRQPLIRKLELGELLQISGTILNFQVAATRDAAEEVDGHQCLLARALRATGKDWAKKLLAKPPKKAGSRAEVRQAAIDRAFGTDQVKIDSQFIKLHQHSKPQWRITAPMAARRDGKLWCAGTQELSAQIQAVQRPPANGDYAVRGTFELRPCRDDAARIQLDWDGKSMVGFFFGVGKWRVETWQLGGEWQQVATGPAPIRAGAPFDAAVEVVGKEARLFVGGQQVGTWDTGARTMRGIWSFGVSDCVVLVDKLRLEPLGAK